MAGSVSEERLGGFWVLDGLSPDDLARIAQFVQEQPAPRGTVLFQQGDQPDRFYLVESGEVREVGVDAAGSEVLRRRAVAGDFVGRWSLMHDARRRATATVAQDAHLLTIDGGDLKTLLALIPPLKERLQRTAVANRLLAIPLFGSFTTEQLFHVADLVRVVELPAGEVIFAEGGPADAFFVIDTGQVVEHGAVGAPGTQAWPKYLSAGGFFGRYALMNRTTRRATAEATSDVKLFRLDAESFHWLRVLQPKFEQALRRPDMLGHLRQIALFSKLKDESLKQLTGYVGLVRFRPHDVIYRQGEVDPTLYMLYRGEALVRGHDEEGKDRPRNYLMAGKAVGESSLFLQEPRDVTVESTTESHWFYLTRADLDQFLAQHPDLADQIVPRSEVRARQALKRLKWMQPDEQLVLRCRRHWFSLLLRLFWPLLLFVIALILFAFPSLRLFGWLAAIVGFLWAVWQVLDWMNDHYVITTARIVHREKLLLVSERRDAAPLEKIQNVNFSQGFIGNLLGFGKLVIDTAATAGAVRVTFDYLANAQAVQSQILEQSTRALAGKRVEVGQQIREKLEQTIGPGIRPVFPRPAVPSPVTAGQPSTSEPGLWAQMWHSTVGDLLWIERIEGDKVTWRKHWVQWIRQTWLPGLVSLGMLLLWVAYLAAAPEPAMLVILPLGLVTLFSLGWLLWEWADWGNDLYIVTNDRIIDYEALPLGFRSQSKETKFDRIQSVSVEIPSPVAMLFKYGTVVVYTAGAEGRLDFVYVSDPTRVHAEIFRRLANYDEAQSRLRRDESWAELPEWFAAYDRTYRT